MTTVTTEPATKAVPKPLNPETSLARRMLPDVDPHSALLPPNKWIIQTLKDTVKTHKGIRGTLFKMAGFTVLGLAAIAGGITGAILAPALIPALVVGAAATAVTAGAGFMIKREAETMKTKYMPDMVEIVKNKYLELKVEEMKRAWQKRAEEKRLEREAKKAAEAAQKAEAARIAAEQAAAPKPETKPAAEEPAAPEKKSGGIRSFGKWALKAAMDKAQQIKDEVQTPPPANDAKPATPPAPPKKNTP